MDSRTIVPDTLGALNHLVMAPLWFGHPLCQPHSLSLRLTASHLEQAFSIFCFYLCSGAREPLSIYASPLGGRWQTSREAVHEWRAVLYRWTPRPSTLHGEGGIVVRNSAHLWAWGSLVKLTHAAYAMTVCRAWKILALPPSLARSLHLKSAP